MQSYLNLETTQLPQSQVDPNAQPELSLDTCDQCQLPSLGFFKEQYIKYI